MCLSERRNPPVLPFPLPPAFPVGIKGYRMFVDYPVGVADGIPLTVVLGSTRSPPVLAVYHPAKVYPLLDGCGKLPTGCPLFISNLAGTPRIPPHASRNTVNFSMSRMEKEGIVITAAPFSGSPCRYPSHRQSLFQHPVPANPHLR